MFYYKVAVAVPYLTFLTYKSSLKLSVGTVVKVEVKKRYVLGIIYDFLNTQEDSGIKEIIGVSDEISLSAGYLNFILKLSNYYTYPIGTVIHKIVPLRFIESTPLDIKERTIEYNGVVLNEGQQIVYDAIKKGLDRFGVYLIYGVTGSGKTEIYCNLINDVISSDGQALYILPEIALTTQLFQRVQSRLSRKAEIYHSKISDKKRKEIIYSFNLGRLPVIVGARSALFIPGKNIKLIIVDEEHDSSFKQEDIPHYHTRDMAVLYGKILNIPVVLGSATPSLESYANALSGKYTILKLEKKYHQNSSTTIEILDMKQEDVVGDFLSKKLYDAIYERVSKDEQTLLLINKKGYSNYIICRNCGYIFQCQNCSVSMTYYKSEDMAKCHYCGGYTKFFKCQHCGETDFFISGTGSEKVYDIVNKLFPEQVIRLDQDIVTSNKRVDAIFEQFATKSKKILVGTQIISKGLNYPDITLIGVINVDNLFTLPDFRVEERAVQLLTQFLGRGGRFDKPCQMIIQTYNPDNPIFGIIKDGDLEKFYRETLEKRRLLGYPPFVKLVRVLIDGVKVDELMNCAHNIADTLKSNAKNCDKILGPSIAPISKIKNRYRVQILLKIHKLSTIMLYRQIVDEVFQRCKKGNMKFIFDVDPYNFM